MDFGGGEDIRFERAGRAGIVTLTRPKALNAVNHRMVGVLARALAHWRADDGVEVVVVKGEGRAFSAGGDILDVYHGGRAGNPPVDFFADEYRLNVAIARFPKPYLSLIDGIVMGGGVGISCHGSHRIMTENAVFAMPEVGIGFFPDVGASHILPELDGSFGMYLALTGNRIRYGDALWSGLATHTAQASDLPGLLDALAHGDDIDLELRRMTSPAPREMDEARLRSIARHFSRPSLEEVVSSLEAQAPADPFAAETLATILKRSPTSLAVTFRQLRSGAGLSIEDCMRMEFRILSRMVAGHDFYEGIRAVLVEKGSTPQWRPATLDAVREADIDDYFAPLGEGELVL